MLIKIYWSDEHFMFTDAFGGNGAATRELLQLFGALENRSDM